MNTKELPIRLREIIDDFEISEGREKIELLIDFAGRLPTPPVHLLEKNGRFEEVPECMTPVSVTAEIIDQQMHFYFQVPQESPTVRGFAAILADGLDGATPEQILRIPSDFYYTMGLEKVLTMQRLNGFTAILAHIKRLATEALNHI